MATFDPFANQGGAAAWDPDHADDSRAIADDLFADLDDDSWPEDVSDDDLDSDLDSDLDADERYEDPIREFDDEYPEPLSS